jgi:hypothetical protein
VVFGVNFHDAEAENSGAGVYAEDFHVRIVSQNWGLLGRDNV